MKRIFLRVIVFVCLVGMFTTACSSALKTTNDASPTRTTSAYEGDKHLPAEKFVSALRINKVDVSRPARVTMELENSSKETLRVWEDSNSWGAACWRLLLIQGGRLETFFQNPDQGFTVNWPEFTQIPAGGHIERKLDLNGGNWCGLGYCSKHYERGFGGNKVSFDSQDMLIVIYDVPPTQEARDNGVWYGVIAATASNEPLKASNNTPNQSNITMNGNEASARPAEKSTNASENSMIERYVPTSNLVKIGKVEVSRAGDIVVEILNVSKKPIKLWKDSNSWGASSWRVLLLRNAQTETFFQNPDQIFTINTPTFNEIAAGGRLEQKLALNGGNWCGMGHCARHDERGFGGRKLSFEPNDTVIVIYDVPVTQEARDNGVWYGVITAQAHIQ